VTPADGARRLREFDVDALVDDIAVYTRFYGTCVGHTLRLPVAWFNALLSRVPRLRAAEKRDILDVVHSSNPAWLQDRLTAIVNSGRQEKQDDETTEREWSRLRAMLGR
jgi:hypothetical protein